MDTGPIKLYRITVADIPHVHRHAQVLVLAGVAMLLNAFTIVLM
ncbi:MAG: hypothetical protein R3B72_08405 [Polyangiaceae bacterium]